VQAGLYITAPTQHVDLFPTLAAIAEVPTADLPGVLDGESLLPFVTSQ
jgi:arylsulfatase A-like enzyme